MAFKLHCTKGCEMKIIITHPVNIIQCEIKLSVYKISSDIETRKHIYIYKK